MTFEIPRHVETLLRSGGEAAPPSLSVTASAITSADFSVLDLGDGGAAAIVVHRVPGLLPGRSARLQYRLDNQPEVDLPLPVGPGVHRVTGLVDDVETAVCLRVSDFDVVSGVERFGEWSPAKAVTTTRFAAENLLSETVDLVSDTSGRWDAGTAWTGPVDSDGFATLASTSALQAVQPDERALVAEGPVTVLAQATLRQGMAGIVTLALSGTAVGGGGVDLSVTLDWSNDGVAVVAGAGVSAVETALLDRDTVAGTARLVVAATLDAGAGTALSYAVEGLGTGLQLPDLRLWQAGSADWPLPEPVEGISQAGRRLPPVVTDFGDATLEAVPGNPESMPFTLFGDETADSGLAPGRASGLTGVTVSAGGSGYADGIYDLPVLGGGGGLVRATVTGGAVSAAEIASEGVGYSAPATVVLDGLPGGSGAAIAVTVGTGRDYWPAINEGETRASWRGRTLGTDGFAVEGFVADGTFVAVGDSGYWGNGHGLAYQSDGHWSAFARGATEPLSEDEGDRQTVGVVIGNGGVRRVLAMPLGFAGARPRKAKITGMPRLIGSGRWGDLMRVLPGAFSDADPAQASVEVAWLLDGQDIAGADQPTLRLSPDVAPLGGEVQARVTWRNGNLVESWVTPALVVGSWKVVADGNALNFGRLTPAGLRGVPIGPAGTTVSGSGSGDWAIANHDGVAFISPATGPSTPGSDPVTSGEATLAASYALLLSDGRTLAVTTEADAYTANGVADLAALAQDLAAPAGQGVHAFDFASGGRIVLWNGGDWGHVDDPADPLSRTTGLMLKGGDADGGATQLVIAPYDTVEPTVVTGPVQILETRNLSWQVDRAHAPGLDDSGSVFAGGRLFDTPRVGRAVVVENCRVEGAAFMAERLARPADPTGTLFGGAIAPLVPEQTPSLTLRNVTVSDLAAVFDAPLGQITIEDCRIQRCGARPLRFALSAGAGNDAAVTLRRSALIDAIGAGDLNPGTWLEITPEGADGFAPVYRPGVAVTVEDCAMLPGQTAAPAMSGIELRRDRLLGDGSAEADFGVVYSPLTLRRVLIVAGRDSGLTLSSGALGTIEDVSIVADARSDAAAPAAVHQNPFRALDSAFAITRSVAGAFTLAGAQGGDGGTALAVSDYDAAFSGEMLERAPRTPAMAGDGFRPAPGGSLDPDASGEVDGAVDRGGVLKAGLTLPPAIALAWGVSSWGSAAMQSGIGWGVIPPQRQGAFRIVATRLSGPAPLGVHFYLDGLSTEEHLFDDVIWDFGPAEDYEFTALPLRSRARRGARYGRGWASAHVFQTIGTHSVIATYRNRAGEVRQAEIEVDALDPDTVFPGASTVCLSVAGDFNGAPAGAQLATSWPEMLGMLEDGDRLLLRGGETYVTNATEFNARESLYVGRFGDPALPRPVIMPPETPATGSSPFRLSSATNSVLTNIVYRDFYDAANPIPAAEHPELSIIRTLFAASGLSPGTVVHNCDVTNCRSAPVLQPRGVMSNCYVTDWYNIGVFSQNAEEAAVIGCQIAQNPNAADFLDLITPNSGESPNGADNGVFRCASTRRTVVAQNHFETWNGWTIDRTANAPDFSQHQPCIRFNITLRPTALSGGVVIDNHCLGGVTTVQIGNANTPQMPIVRNEGTLIAGNFLEAERQTKRLVFAYSPDVAISNNVFTKQTTEIQVTPITRAVVLRDNNNDAEAAAAPRHVIFNTIDYDIQQSDADLVLVDQERTNTPFILLDNAVTADQHPNAASFPEIGPLENFAPLAGAPIDGTSTSVPPVRDYRARLRGVPASQGAMEVFAPEVLDLGSGVDAASVATGAVLDQTDKLTLVARIARDDAGSRTVVALDGGGLTLLSPSDRLALTLDLNNASPLVDTELDGIAAQGAFVSIMLAVDLAGGLTGGRTVSLYVDGVERYAQTTGGGGLLADPAGATLFAGTAGARLSHALWLDTAVALDPAQHYYADFFNADNTPRNLAPSGMAAGVIPSVYFVAKPAGLGQAANQGSGGLLAASGPIATL
ncbi:MAG: hypothetical protein AAF577_00875 [Pseudomonadota bacterium]